MHFNKQQSKITSDSKRHVFESTGDNVAINITKVLSAKLFLTKSHFLKKRHKRFSHANKRSKYINLGFETHKTVKPKADNDTSLNFMKYIILPEGS